MKTTDFLVLKRVATPSRRCVQLACSFASLAAGGLLAVSCSAPKEDPAELDAPIFGSSRPTTYLVAPTDSVLHVRDLARTARILRKYKTMDAAERALVKSAVAKRLHGLIALEIHRLEPKYRAERERLRRLPDKGATAREIARLDEDIRKQALVKVAARLAGHDLAVPLKTADSTSAVAFARVDGERIDIFADAYELDRPLASLREGDQIEGKSRSGVFIASQSAPVGAAER